MPRPRGTSEEGKDGFFHRPQGAPRGLLVHYVLHRISQKPAHGYEILQDIEDKTEGAWRPGAGSIYPMLKKMVAEDLITEESDGGKDHADHRTYHITKKGLENVKAARGFFSSVGQKWGMMRKILVEMLEPEDIGKFLVNGSRAQFETAQVAVESKLTSLPQSEARLIMKEYALSLERQLDWTNAMLEKLGGRDKIKSVVSVQTARKSRGHPSK